MGGFVFYSLGTIVCDADGTNDRFVITIATIAPDDRPLHSGATVAVGGGDVGFIAIRRSDIHTMVDLLRHERPVYVQIHAGATSVFNRIFTGVEPVGEGEAAV